MVFPFAKFNEDIRNTFNEGGPFLKNCEFLRWKWVFVKLDEEIVNEGWPFVEYGFGLNMFFALPNSSKIASQTCEIGERRCGSRVGWGDSWSVRWESLAGLRTRMAGSRLLCKKPKGVRLEWQCRTKLYSDKNLLLLMWRVPGWVVLVHGESLTRDCSIRSCWNLKP